MYAIKEKVDSLFIVVVIYFVEGQFTYKTLCDVSALDFVCFAQQMNTYSSESITGLTPPWPKIVVRLPHL